MDRKHYALSWVFVGLVFGSMPLAAHGQDTTHPHLESAYAYLNMIMDQFHTTVDVYTDLGAAGNHFATRCGLAEGNNVAGVAMDEAWSQQCHAGGTCIKNTFARLTSTYWGGWYFQNGVLRGTDNQPSCNWGTVADAGVDLTGATRVTFWARGERGGERIEFFVGGVGRDAFNGRPTTPYPDSLTRVPGAGRTTTLTKEWQQYTIDVRGGDLSSVLGGFAWVANVPNNPTGATFYVDDIRYDKARLDEPRFLVSFQTLPGPPVPNFDTILQNVAFIYDNAVVLLAYLARGTVDDLRRARLLADAFVYALEHDRFYDDARLRNAYQAGDLALPPGWTPQNRVATARLPGRWDTERDHWVESGDHVGSTTGNIAWVMIALLKAYQVLGDGSYLEAASRMGTWVEVHTRDSQGPGGYTGGSMGWEPTPDTMTWKSTEHNLDLYVAFRTLAEVTGDTIWHERALHAQRFLQAMWQACGPDHFATGTDPDKVTPNCAFAPIDVNTWGLMALKDEVATYATGVDWVLDHARVTESCFAGQQDPLAMGLDFNEDGDGIWWEGTAHTVIALRILGGTRAHADADAFITNLRHTQDFAPHADQQGIVATCRDKVSTGIEDFFFFNRLHIAATAWYAMAEQWHNPFWDVTGMFRPPFHDFDPVVEGMVSQAQRFTIANQAEVPLTIDFITLQGADASDFRLQNNTCTGHTLPGASTCTFEVIFVPVRHGVKLAKLYIAFRNPHARTQEVPLRGVGVSANCPTCFLESFEEGWGQWSTDQGIWAVGAPTVGPQGCYHGTGCVGTALTGTYDSYTDSRLVSPAMALPQLSGAEELHLRFWQWFSYAKHDGGHVQIAVRDAATQQWSAWTTLGEPVIESSGVWAPRAIDVTAYAGKTVRFAFYHTANRSNVSSESSGWFLDQIEVIRQAPAFAGDFEEGWGQWSTDQGIWAVGAPTVGPQGCYHGTGCAGTALTGTYDSYTDSRLVSPAMALPQLSGAEELHLRFWQWFSYAKHDGGHVQIAVRDAATQQWSAWTTLGEPVIESSGVWAPRAIDVTAYAGKTVRFAFYHTANRSNVSSESSGWFLDQIEVIRQAPAFAGDFEEGWGQWSTDQGIWAVGAPTVGPQGCYHGTGCVGTALTGTYDSYTDSRLVSPAMALPQLSGAEELHLRFWQWFSYAKHDGGHVQIAVRDAATQQWSAWTTLGEPVIESSGVWAPRAIDVTAYAGKTVRFAFYHTANRSNVSSESSGWFLDQIEVIRQAPAFAGDFEEGWGQWSTDQGIWAVGAPTVGPQGCYHGTGCAGTALTGTYDSYTDSRLVSPAMALPQLSGAEELHLRFWQWFSYAKHDGGHVQIAVRDAATQQWSAWTILGEPVIESSGVWAPRAIDVTAYAGKTVRFAFYHTANRSGVSSESSGWFLDQIEVSLINSQSGL